MTHTSALRLFGFESKKSAIRRKAMGWTALSTTILAASTYSAFAKDISGSLSPLSLFFVSEIVILFGLLFSYGFVPTLKKFLRIKPQMLLPLLVIGLTSGTLAPLLLFAGLQTSTAVNASLFGNSEMAFLILLAVIFLHEKFTRMHALSVLAIVAGMVVIAFEGFSVQMQLHIGDLFMILSGFVFAVGSITFRKYLHHCDPEIPLLSRSIIALSCFFLLSPFITHPLITEIRHFPVALIPALLGFALIARLLNVFSFYEAMERLPITTISLVCNLGVITSALFAHFYLLEPIYLYHVAGGMLIVAGTVLLEFAGWHPTTRHHWFHLRMRQEHRA